MKSIENKSFSIILQGEQLIALNDRRIGEISRFCQLVEHGGDLHVQPFSDTAVLLELRKRNISKENQPFTVTFPSLKLLKQENWQYCFPSLEPFISSACTEYNLAYSTWFPMQFLSVFGVGGRVLTLVSLDETQDQKRFYLNKTIDGAVYAKIHYQGVIPSEDTLILRLVLDIRDGDWHESLYLYRQLWEKRHLNGAVSPIWLQKAYIFRQWFLHENYDDGIFERTSLDYCIKEKLQKDRQALGGVDYVQLFDWGQTPENGRVGDYMPWEYLGGSSRLASGLKYLRSNGVRTGLYFEGYLISRSSRLGQLHGRIWQVLDVEQKMYSYAGTAFWTCCSRVQEWHQSLYNKMALAINLLMPDAVYIDEYGCGIQYACHSDVHRHCTMTQLDGERMFLKKASSLNTSILTEYFPVDSTIMYQQAALTYGKGLINLTRFAFPLFRQFVIIRCDAPIGNDIQSLKRIFFNGQGIWVSGNVNDEKWVSSEFLFLLRKMYHILKQNRQFRSRHCVPLLYHDPDGISVNSFIDEEAMIWTIYNASKNRKYEVFSFSEPMDIYDVWNNKNMGYSVKEVKISLGAGEVSCLKLQSETNCTSSQRESTRGISIHR